MRYRWRALEPRLPLRQHPVANLGTPLTSAEFSWVSKGVSRSDRTSPELVQSQETVQFQPLVGFAWPNYPRPAIRHISSFGRQDLGPPVLLADRQREDEAEGVGCAGDGRASTRRGAIGNRTSSGLI